MTLEEYGTVALQRVAAAVMRAYLDYDAGLGSEPLRRFLTSEAEASLDERQPPVRPEPSAWHASVGPYAVLRLDGDRTYVCAGVLQPGGVSTVLAVELVERDGALRAARIGRAAEAATSDASLPEQPRLVGDGQPPPEPPPHLRAMLGDFPDTGEARERWLLGAAVVDTYRERHGVHDAGVALGDHPEDAEQRAERDRAVQYLRVLASEIARLEPDRATEPPAREATRDRELGG